MRSAPGNQLAGRFSRSPPIACAPRRPPHSAPPATHKHQLLSRALSLDCTPPLTVSPTPISDLGSPTPAGAHGDPVSVLLVHEQLTALRAAWPTLTAKERAVLSGVLNGKSHRQLAIELACTAKTVGRALRRARRKLATQEVLAA